jgi:hypothetical protein
VCGVWWPKRRELLKQGLRSRSVARTANAPRHSRATHRRCAGSRRGCSAPPTNPTRRVGGCWPAHALVAPADNALFRCTAECSRAAVHPCLVDRKRGQVSRRAWPSGRRAARCSGAPAKCSRAAVHPCLVARSEARSHAVLGQAVAEPILHTSVLIGFSALSLNVIWPECGQATKRALAAPRVISHVGAGGARCPHTAAVRRSRAATWVRVNHRGVRLHLGAGAVTEGRPHVQERTR